MNLDPAVEEEFRRLEEEIAGHDRRYHGEARPTVSDFAYDQLRRRQGELLAAHPSLQTLRPGGVGDDRLDRFPKKNHREPMLSLNNTYGEDELRRFVERVERAAAGPVDFVVEPKIDGVALAITYRSGRLAHALTRGNGLEGDVVTENLRAVADIPRTIPAEGKEGEESVVEVRGEIHVEEKDFQAMNAEREEMGEEPYANARNLAAGSLKLLDPKESARRRLHFLAYEILGYAIGTQWEVLETLRRWQFPSNGGALARGFAQVWQRVEELGKSRSGHAFATDGAVVKANDRSLRAVLGAQSSAPRWAIAYKFAPERVETLLEDIRLRVGRTGVVTPVAVLSPVHLAGSTIRSATLHNGDDIARKDLRIGDTVFLEKAGEVIPAVVAPVPEKRPASALPFAFPSQCPACGEPLVRIDGEVAHRCLNPDCPPQLARRLEHFASRAALDIATLGPARIAQLLERGLVRHFVDIYSLDADSLAALPGMGPRSAKNLLAAVDASRRQPTWRLLHGLGIPHVGAETAKLLLRRWPSLQDLAAAERDELCRCDGVGEVVAAGIFRFFRSPANRKLLETLSSLGFAVFSPTPAIGLVAAQSPARELAGPSPFRGKNFAITGSFSSLGREELRRRIEERGGSVREALSRRVDVLLVGERPGSKRAEAERLGIATAGEDVLFRWLQESESAERRN